MIKNNLISITLKLLFHTRSFSFIAFLIFLSICFPRAYALDKAEYSISRISISRMACRNYQSLPLHKTPKVISGLQPAMD